MEIQTEMQAAMRDHVSDWEKSKLSQIEYCRQKGLVFSRFNYWVRRLHPRPEPLSGFVPIKLKKERTDSSRPALEVVLPSGARINFYHPVDPAFVKSILF